MEPTALIQIVSFIFGIGLVWGSLNTRIKQLERELHSNRDLAERLTRIEEKVLYIAENLKK
jgi:glucose-6-phosphate-specific signal transduction histidine kinase